MLRLRTCLSTKTRLYSPSLLNKRLRTIHLWRKISTTADGTRGSVSRSDLSPLQAMNGGGGGGGGDDKTGSLKSTGGNDDDDSSNKSGSFLTMGYALLILIGGVMGYVKRRSKMSLITSASVFVVLLFCSIGMGLGPWRTPSMVIAVLGSGALSGFFLKRYLATKKVFPGLVGSVLSLAMSAFYLFNLDLQ